jgi:hypothetical protein
MLLSVSLWELIILSQVFNPVTVPVITAVWFMFGLFHYRNQPEAFSLFSYAAYRKYYGWFFAGIGLSIVPAYLNWNQDVFTSLIVNRGLVIYAFIPLLMIIKPTDREIVRALIYYSIVYMLVWVVQALLVPIPLTVPFLFAISSGAPFVIDPTDFGKLLPGYTLIVLLFYLQLQQFRQQSTFKKLLPVLLVFGVLFLLQNRGTLFFATAVFGLVLLQMKSNYKPYIMLFFAAVGVVVVVYTYDSWIALFAETAEQAGDGDYNRWKALSFFLFEYSPNWLSYILGNGRFSIQSEAGVDTYLLSVQGYDQSDIGIIGFWSIYGLLPVAVMYVMIAHVIRRNYFPFYLKALAFHMLLIPIAWNFTATDAMVLILFFYLYAYYSEASRIAEANVLHEEADYLPQS